MTPDGVLWGWGDNGGELGDGTKADRDRPVKIAENVKRILPNYFVTKSNDWYNYSERYNYIAEPYRPKIQLQNVLYVLEHSTSFGLGSVSMWYHPNGRLCLCSHGSKKIEVYDLISNIKLPSIVRASDGQVIAPRPEQLVARAAAAPNDNGNPGDVDAIAFVKGQNFLDACLPRRDKNAESEEMQKLTIGEAFDVVPQFRQQRWEVLPGGADGTQTVSLDFVIINDVGGLNQAKIIFNAAARISTPPSIRVDGAPRVNNTFFGKMYDELKKSKR